MYCTSIVSTKCKDVFYPFICKILEPIVAKQSKNMPTPILGPHPLSRQLQPHNDFAWDLNIMFS